MPKRKLRQCMLDKRRTLAAEERRYSGRLIQQAFVALPEFAEARIVALYSPIGGEVETGEVMEAALKEGKIVIFPVVCGDCLRFVKVSDPSEMTKGAFGIAEPCLTGEAYPPDAADLVVVPGVAFDRAGKRIGFGKGYYDRALHHLEGSGKLVAFCYDFQLVDEIVAESHDVAVDVIITEKRVITLHGYQ
ncbi:5-formyltetrahydrofolate cyclo-ligase [Geobacter metallireducens RCH3]|uniref:5-formyltetrahydrofolate cyclo-ligase n=1 Tax=Geobacter metallireducens (strain ATCC 53774 / DSM 7210 / GS-15) TaxID=269799 RepID=Q39WF7_GEOMG|nr:5-formyltetrahydrofolate cyclo-ligase [Geobacter metallireducens]ABB31417.1 5-formyltetrahydrofolate cyclo-ligase [Geobacter metallireducens GS-15]EHP86227.1 5-formyltetrahydrofolate cyclo-ligase [Geobacter metallireducens RCH3]